MHPTLRRGRSELQPPAQIMRVRWLLVGSSWRRKRRRRGSESPVERAFLLLLLLVLLQWGAPPARSTVPPVPPRRRGPTLTLIGEWLDLVGGSCSHSSGGTACKACLGPKLQAVFEECLHKPANDVLAAAVSGHPPKRGPDSSATAPPRGEEVTPKPLIREFLAKALTAKRQFQARSSASGSRKPVNLTKQEKGRVHQEYWAAVAAWRKKPGLAGQKPAAHGVRGASVVASSSSASAVPAVSSSASVAPVVASSASAGRGSSSSASGGPASSSSVSVSSLVEFFSALSSSSPVSSPSAVVSAPSTPQGSEGAVLALRGREPMEIEEVEVEESRLPESAEATGALGILPAGPEEGEICEDRGSNNRSVPHTLRTSSVVCVSSVEGSTQGGSVQPAVAVQSSIEDAPLLIGRATHGWPTLNSPWNAASCVEMRNCIPVMNRVADMISCAWDAIVAYNRELLGDEAETPVPNTTSRFVGRADALLTSIRQAEDGMRRTHQIRDVDGLLLLLLYLMSETFSQRQNILGTGGDAAVFFSTVMMQIVTLSENFSLPGEIDWQVISERVLGFVLRLTADVDARARLSGVSGGRSWPRQPTTSPPVASSDVARLYAVQFALHNRVLFQAAPIGATVFSTRAIPLTPSGCWDGTIRQTLTPGAVVRLTRIQRPSDEVLALADTPNRQLITEAYAECETLPTTGSSRKATCSWQSVLRGSSFAIIMAALWCVLFVRRRVYFSGDS